ncbi:MAG: hypothetical protein ABW321_00810 [Polyangiales bacterium]
MPWPHSRAARLWLATSVAAAGACAEGASSADPFAADSGTDAAASKPDAAPSGDAAAVEQPASYRAVSDIIQKSCAYPRCHDGAYVGGALSLPFGSNFATALVDVDACQYPKLKRVEPYHPERSWLMIKLTTEERPDGDPFAGFIAFEPDADWDPSTTRCPSVTGDAPAIFGTRMPATAPDMLPADEIEVIRSWIAEGAPYEP